MMSMFNHLKKISEQGESWEKYEMESFESPSLNVKKDNSDFISLKIGNREKTDFIPFAEEGNKRNKRKEMEDTLQEAQEKADLLEQEEYEKGFAQGEKDGFELGEKKAIKILENIEKLFTEIGHLKKELIKKSEKEILDLIFTIAEKIIHHQIKSDEGVLREAVFNALNLAAEKNNVIFHVNPEDYEYLENIRPELFLKFKELKSVIVNSDPAVSRGGCFLETPYGDVNAGIETQLEVIYQCLEETYTENEDD